MRHAAAEAVAVARGEPRSTRARTGVARTFEPGSKGRARAWPCSTATPVWQDSQGAAIVAGVRCGRWQFRHSARSCTITWGAVVRPGAWQRMHPHGEAGESGRKEWQSAQAGEASVRFAMWSGSAASWENLSLVLPGSWGDTVARSIWSDGAFMYVAGFGLNNISGHDEALLWTRPVPAPAAACVFVIGWLAIPRHRRG